VEVHPDERGERGSEQDGRPAGLGVQKLTQRRLQTAGPGGAARERRPRGWGAASARSARPPRALSRRPHPGRGRSRAEHGVGAEVFDHSVDLTIVHRSSSLCEGTIARHAN
jgi:hypothetical protein